MIYRLLKYWAIMEVVSLVCSICQMLAAILKENEKVKKLLALTLLIGLVSPLFGQYTAKVTEGKYSADLDVKISDNVYFKDLEVEISNNVNFEDFTIGFTNSKNKADVIISDKYSADFEVNIKSSFADIVIEVSDNVYSEDIGIEIRESGYVDYLVYSDLDSLSKEMLVCALLPIINLHLDEDDRLEDVPIYKAPNSKYDTWDNNSEFVEPVIISQIDGEFEGWEGETIFRLMNGQVWQQSSYDYMYHYAYMPEVEIYETKNGYIMKVEDVEETIDVVRLK